MKFRMVEDCRDTWSVQALCRVLGISTAGYYAWRSRPDSKRTVEDHALLVDIRQAHADSGGRYGSPRVHAALRAHGKKAGRGRIERLMRRHGIRGLVAPRRRVHTTDSCHPFPIAPNLLDRTFSATTKPNAVWLADLTYIATNEGWLYMAAIMDLHTRKIVGDGDTLCQRPRLLERALSARAASRTLCAGEAAGRLRRSLTPVAPPWRWVMWPRRRNDFSNRTKEHDLAQMTRAAPV